MDSTREALRSALTESGELSILNENDEGMNAYAFRAHQPNMGRDVFVKAFYYSEDDADEILREPKILVDATSGNQNRNLVQVYDGGVITVGEDKYFRLLMEYVEGRSLLKELETRCIGQQEAVRITLGILAGLSQLHGGSNRILHRDLKPANILLSCDGEAKITDFGSCAYLPQGQSNVGASRHSPIYVPPEGWSSPSCYSIESDLYQVGIVLYELINGSLNYDEEHWVPVSRIRELKSEGNTLKSLDDFDRSKEIENGINWFATRAKLLYHGSSPRPYYSNSLKRIVMKATKPNPAERYTNSGDFITALSRVSVPNWTANPDGTFECTDCNGWDWRVNEVNKKSGRFIEVSRARAGVGKWMRQNALQSESYEEAFRKVEKA